MPVGLVHDYAAAHDADLVVMNARGTRAFRSRLRGDLVPAVIRAGSVPVSVVPGVQPGHPD